MSGTAQVVILMPLRDDWESATVLIRNLDQTLKGASFHLRVLVVDDASAELARPGMFGYDFATLQCIQVLRLRRNLSHQRAIAIGLAYIEQALPGHHVLVMDSDGEDTPEGALQLLTKFCEDGCKRAIFAERIRRSESLQFRVFYHLYRFVHRCLTGIQVRVGNFSILPSAYLGTLSVVSEIWNHYAAAVFRSRLPYTMTPIPRGDRIAGVSRMNFAALVGHGLSAISVFGDVVGIRILIASGVGFALAALAILAVIGVRLFTQQAIPGWATYTTGFLVIVMMQLLAMASTFTFLVLFSRSNMGFLPARDYPLFVAGIQDVYGHD